jgi:alkylated DNA repair dioxygenase AlkB
MTQPRSDQPSLFADPEPDPAPEPALDPAFTGAERHALDATSWVEIVPGWVSRGEALMAEILQAAEFEQRQRWMYDKRVDEPRLTAEYRELGAAPPFLRALAEALSAHYGVPYDGLWINLYRDERDSTGWHRDHATCRKPECVVPVLTLGATRRFLLRPADGGASTGFSPTSGDLVVMGGRCQSDWKHCVPKQRTSSGPRVSINFSSTSQFAP